MISRDAAVWFRVSTEEQQTSNQIPEVERFCDHHDLRIVRRFVLNDSAWQNGTGGPEYQAALKEMLDGAWRGEDSVVVVWALDRITRLGIEAASAHYPAAPRERSGADVGAGILDERQPGNSGSHGLRRWLDGAAGIRAEVGASEDRHGSSPRRRQGRRRPEKGS